MTVNEIDSRVRKAVAHFWSTRRRQAKSQRKGGKADQGSRGAVTGGAQMNGFIDLLADLVMESGIPDTAVFRHKALELPGFFRPTKEWDILVVMDGKLLAAIEAKSQVGPSFGNNFNNRTEEVIGSAVDIWTAYRDGAFVNSPRPWLGYVFLLEDCHRSRQPVRVKEPHFKVFAEFRSASYMNRYELLCRKLVRERHYDAAAFLASEKVGGVKGVYRQPADDLRFDSLASSLVAQVSAFAANRKS